MKRTVAVVVGLLLAPAGAAPARAATATYKVLTWNVAGWTLHNGSATNGLAQAVANAVRNADADFFALNELCFDLIFVRDNRYTGSYDADSVAIPTSCGGPCSDHRLVRGTVTVTTS